MKVQLGKFFFSLLGLTLFTSAVASAGEPMPPSTAKVFNSVQSATTWGHCSDCAADPSNPNPPIASWTFNKFQNTPSLSGSSTKMGISGSDPYSNVLHWTKFGAQGAYRHFMFEFYIFGNLDMNNAQNLEFDFWQSHNGRKYMFGTQCNYAKGIWQGWNEPNNHWVDLPIPCKKFATGAWTRVKWYIERTTDNRMHYISVTVGNTTYAVNHYEPTITTTWGESTGLQFQQDMNKYAVDYTVWIDKARVCMW